MLLEINKMDDDVASLLNDVINNKSIKRKPYMRPNQFTRDEATDLLFVIIENYRNNTGYVTTSDYLHTVELMSKMYGFDKPDAAVKDSETVIIQFGL